MTGKALKNAFHKKSAGKKGEIQLFQAFIDAFNSLGANALAKEYHGNKYQVIFDEMRGAGRPTPRCELCDVMIIQYPNGHANAARVTFNQAKVTKNDLGCSPSKAAVVPDSFGANLEQWDLLSNRPTVRNATTTFYPPSNLLSDAILPSVGTFGVFYPLGSSFDFAYYVACGLRPLSNNPGRTGTLQWLAPMNFISRRAGYDEITGTCCLEAFGDALEHGLVGTPVWPLLYGPRGSRPMQQWLRDVLLSLAQENPDSSLPDELLNGLELISIEGERDHLLRDNAPSTPRAVILVKTPREPPLLNRRPA
ncbi:hypothetical protein [Pseudomonas sp. B707]|uniref:hypothetical protein n=1 Tax=Pseudomonas sp. B707 TaxID=2689570 RepID=UPI001F119369|nr:hypothetical protein [Pseudomonas sp. B707]MCH4900584.1 hypothetical protein [Pseudomonas sp. B707]